MIIKALYGGEAVVVFDPLTRKLEMLCTVLGEGNLESKVDAIPLTGGSYNAPVKMEKGLPSYTFTSTIKQITNGMFRVLEGAKVTERAPEVAGFVGAVRALIGNSAAAFTPTIIEEHKDNLPFGFVAIECTSTGKGKVFVMGSLKQGPSGWKAEDGSVTADEIALTGTIQLEDLGLQVEIASAAQIQVGDRMEFEVRPPNKGTSRIEVYGGNVSEKGIMVVLPRQSDGSMHRLVMPRVFLSGLPLSFKERAFAEHSITGTLMVEESTGCVYAYEGVEPQR